MGNKWIYFSTFKLRFMVYIFDFRYATVVRYSLLSKFYQLIINND